MWSDRVGDQVRTIGVGAVVVLGARLPLGVGFHQKAAEVRAESVDLVRLGAPPLTDCRIHGVGALKTSYLQRRAETGGQIDVQAIRSEQIGERRELLEVGCGQTDS